nr:MAG TPA: hypothetical protein [Caudoviricetes sp.]
MPLRFSQLAHHLIAIYCDSLTYDAHPRSLGSPTFSICITA